MATSEPTTLFKTGMTPQTATAISSRNKVYATAYGAKATKNTQVGVLGTFDPTHGRGADPVRGVGFGDQIAELVPNVSDPVTISVTRTLLYLSNIFQVFGYAGGIAGIVRSLKHHKWPFDIKQELVISELSNNKGGFSANAVTPDLNAGDSVGAYTAIITNYEGCWITSYSTSFPSDSTIVTENADISVTDITALGTGADYQDSALSTGNDLTTQGKSALFG